MVSWIKKSYDLMGATVHHPYANYLLGLLFYAEAIFFLPTDPILIVYCLERRHKAFFYASIALLGSVLGGITSYFIGAILWNTCGEQIIHNSFVNYIMTPAQFHNLAAQYEYYNWIFVFIAGFTPVPYKAATLTAGFCKISLIPFILSSICARGARFFLFALICNRWGEKIKDSFQKYFNLILLITVVIILITLWLFT